MKKKHLIKTVDDIKYCEENHIVLTDSLNKKAFCIFDNNTWIWSDSKTSLYNVQLSLDGTLYYYEEQEQQEAQKSDIGKLCWFYDTYNRKVVGKLREILQDDNFPFRSDYGIPSVHCCPLTKEEIKEFMEKAE